MDSESDTSDNCPGCFSVEQLEKWLKTKDEGPRKGNRQLQRAYSMDQIMDEMNKERHKPKETKLCSQLDLWLQSEREKARTKTKCGGFCLAAKNSRDVEELQRRIKEIDKKQWGSKQAAADAWCSVDQLERWLKERKPKTKWVTVGQLHEDLKEMDRRTRQRRNHCAAANRTGQRGREKSKTPKGGDRWCKLNQLGDWMENMEQREKKRSPRTWCTMDKWLDEMDQDKPKAPERSVWCTMDDFEQWIGEMDEKKNRKHTPKSRKSRRRRNPSQPDPGDRLISVRNLEDYMKTKERQPKNKPTRDTGGWCTRTQLRQWMDEVNKKETPEKIVIRGRSHQRAQARKTDSRMMTREEMKDIEKELEKEAKERKMMPPPTTPAAQKPLMVTQIEKPPMVAQIEEPPMVARTEQVRTLQTGEQLMTMKELMGKQKPMTMREPMWEQKHMTMKELMERQKKSDHLDPVKY